MGRRKRRGDMTPRERERARAQEKKGAYERSQGRYVQVSPDRAIAHVRRLHELGMTGAQMSDQVGNAITKNVFLDLIRGTRTKDKGSPPVKHIDRPDEQIILSVRYEPPVAKGSDLDPTGARRRLGALAALGYPVRFLAQQLGVSGTRGHGLLRREGNLSASVVMRIAELYDKLSATDPADLGMTAYQMSRARGYARSYGYAPPWCWDTDTIDDPAAAPEWTGRCGSWWGWHIHQRDGIPVCERCEPFEKEDPYPGFDGRLLRELRESKGVSRVTLAERVGGMHPTAIQYWETGRSKPVRQNKLDRVLAALDATLEDVCRKENEDVR